MLSPFVLKGLEVAPSTFFHVIDDIRPEKYRERLEEDRFDLVEMVAHLADFEDLFLDRMRLAHEHPDSECVSLDPDARATEKHYATRDLHHELEVFRNRRNDTMDFLRTLQPGEETRCVKHPVMGDLSIEAIANSLLGHDMYHLEQASRYLR
ncbi:MAG: DinB family protein [Fimbriimonas sp.]